SATPASWTPSPGSTQIVTVSSDGSFTAEPASASAGDGNLSTSTAPGSPAMLAMLAIKPSQPPTYPNPLGAFIDPVSREQTRAQCRAAGLWGSLTMDSQQSASNWIGQLTQAANCAPVSSGFRLKLIPRSEASAAGNGAVYIAPTVSGPVADLDAD